MYSIIVPLYNEKENIDILYGQLKAENKKPDRDCEIIFVDDGSTDGTADALSIISAKDKNVKAIIFRRNFGKSAALSAGFREAKGDVIITMDGDLQDDPREMANLIRELEKGSDMACGYRKKRADSLLKWASSLVFNRVVAAVTGLNIHDVNCGYKAMRREVLPELEIYGEMHRFIPTLAHWKGFKVSEVAISHRPRKYGRSKYGPDKSVRGFLDLVTLVFLTRYKRRPAHFFGGLGMALGLAGLAVCLYIVRLKVIFGNIQGRQPLLMAGVLFIIVGMQLVSTGLIGEMITHIFRKDSVEYTIKRKINC